MKAALAKLFSDRYANRAAVGANLLLLGMYRFAYPFALVLRILRLSPNQITTLSLLSAALAAYALTLQLDAWFYLFWAGAVLLDFCDGTVARMTGEIRKTAFRYDHSSDLGKIFLVILGCGCRYESTQIWVLSASAIFFFMFYMVLNHDLGVARQRRSDSAAAQPDTGRVASIPRVSFVQSLKVVLLTINGHTLLVFFLLPLGDSGAILGLSYFLMLSLLRAARCIHIMLGLPK